MSNSNWTDFDIGYGSKPKPAAPPPQPAGWSTTKVVLVFLVVVVAATASALGTRRLMTNARQRFHDQLVADAFQQYQIVDSGDDLMAKALRAGVVAEAYLMAKDSDNYHKWKKIADDWDALAKQKIEAETKAMMRRFSR